MADAVAAAPLLRACLEVMREAGEPLRGREVMGRTAHRVMFSPYELEHVRGHNEPRWETHLRWATGDAATVGWMSKRDGLWSLTEAGEAALDEYDDQHLVTELKKRFRHIRRQREKATKALSGVEHLIARALSVVDAGSWTSYDDVAELVGASPGNVPHYLAGMKRGLPTGYRVLYSDGRLPPDGMRHMDHRGMDLERKLRSEGVEFGDDGRASLAQRMTARDIEERLRELDEPGVLESPITRAWLVRGSSVDGRDLVPVWVVRGSMSLAAGSLRPITPPVSRAELKTFVDEDYRHRSYAARETKVIEFDAFCNRMRPGDYVLTFSQGKTYVGRIDGDATYVASQDKRSNLRRPVTWLNKTRSVPFAKLPDPLPARLSNQDDVVELTEDIAAIEELLAELGIEEPKRDPDATKELAFRPITDELCQAVFMDRAWLQRQAELLWDQKQLIFHGPPGTGKTFLATHLAETLADPSAVKLVQFHPSYTYEDFFEGFRPEKRDDGNLVFNLRPGPFRQLVEAAAEHPSDPYILIIDEINRANLAKVFGELYFLLEYRDQRVSLLYSSEKAFRLPPNVFLIGTMNTTDRSIALVDAAMRRRFAFVELHPSTPPVAGVLTAWLSKQDDVRFNRDTPALLHALNARIEDRDLAVGPSYFLKPEIYRREDGLERVWETQIMPLLAEYHYGSPPEVLRQFQLDTLRKALTVNGGEDG